MILHFLSNLLSILQQRDLLIPVKNEINSTDTRVKFIDRKLHKSGWKEESILRRGLNWNDILEHILFFSEIWVE